MRRTEKPEVRRQQILDAARLVLIEQGYSEVLLDEVARRAGVAKGTLYLYFQDKQHLYAAVMVKVLEGLQEKLTAAVQSAKSDPMAQLKDVVVAMLTYVEGHQDFFMSCAQGRTEAGGKKVGEEIKKQFERHLRFLSVQIQKCVVDGDLRPHDAKTGSLFLVALVRMFMMRKVFHGHKALLRASADELMDLYVNGLGNSR